MKKLIGYSKVTELKLNNEDYNNKLEPTEIHELYYKDFFSKKVYRQKTWTRSTMCGSGYCCATYGEKEPLEEVQAFSMQYIYTGPTYEYKAEEEYICDDVQELYDDGGDSYYPSGNADVKLDLFKQVKPVPYTRKVFIIQGPSGSGKTTLASYIGAGVSVYDTDNGLKDEYEETVIVLSPRHDLDYIVDGIIKPAEIILLTAEVK